MKQGVIFSLILIPLLMLYTLMTASVAYAEGESGEKTTPGISIEEAIKLGTGQEGVKPTYIPGMKEGASVEASVQQTIGRIINGLLFIAGVIAVYFIVVNGWNMQVAGGDQTAIENAKKGLMWSILGLVLIILSYAIVRAIIKVALSTGLG